jgi:hypothetical protein
MNISAEKRTFDILVPDEGTAHALLVQARWDGKVQCECGSFRARAQHTRPGWWQCADCRHQFSVRSGTALHGTSKPLRDWVYAMWRTAGRSGMSARQFGFDVGYRRYQTGWEILHKLRATLDERDDRLLSGKVCLELGWFGIGRTARGDPPGLPPVFVGRAAELREPIGYRQVRLEVLDVAPAEHPSLAELARSLTDACEHRVAPGAEVAWEVERSRWSDRSKWAFLEMPWLEFRDWVWRAFGGVSRRFLPHYLAQHVWSHNRRNLDPKERFTAILRRVLDEPFLAARDMPFMAWPAAPVRAAA